MNLSPLLLKKNFLFLSFSFSLSGFSSSSFFLLQSSILIRPCLFTQSVAPLYSILTLCFCPAPTEAQPSADHSLRSPPQRPNLRAPPSLCYLKPSADVGLCLCFPICCGQWACAHGGFFFFFSCFGLVVVVLVVVVAVAVTDGRGGCGWCCDFFWVVEYIILL